MNFIDKLKRANEKVKAYGDKIRDFANDKRAQKRLLKKLDKKTMEITKPIEKRAAQAEQFPLVVTNFIRKAGYKKPVFNSKGVRIGSRTLYPQYPQNQYRRFPTRSRHNMTRAGGHLFPPVPIQRQVMPWDLGDVEAIRTSKEVSNSGRNSFHNDGDNVAFSMVNEVNGISHNQHNIHIANVDTEVFRHHGSNKKSTKRISDEVNSFANIVP